MPRNNITFEQVAAAADNLTHKGVNPTLRRIREHLGTGSLNIIQRHFTAWRSNRPATKRAPIELPQNLLSVLLTEIEQQTETAREEAERLVEEIHSDASTLAELGETLETRNEQLSNRLDAVEKALELATSRRDALSTEGKALRDELKHEHLGRLESREQLAKTTQQAKMLAAQLEEEQKARQNAERATKTAEASRIKAERDRAVAEAQRDAALEQARERAEQLEAQRQALQAERTQQRKEVSDMRAGHKARLDKAEQARQDALKQAQEATQRASKAEIRAEALEATQIALKSRLDTLQFQKRQVGVGSRRTGSPRQEED